MHAAYGHIGVSDPDRDGFHAMMYSMYNVGGDNDQIMAGISNGLDDGLVLTDPTTEPTPNGSKEAAGSLWQMYSKKKEFWEP